MFTPEDAKRVEIVPEVLDALEKQIDASIAKFHGWYPWEYAILYNEYAVVLRDAIAKRYLKAGWNYVYHGTSSENGERPGLTSFSFSMDPIEHWNGKHCLKREDLTKEELNGQ